MTRSKVKKRPISRKAKLSDRIEMGSSSEYARQRRFKMNKDPRSRLGILASQWLNLAQVRVLENMARQMLGIPPHVD